MQSTNTSFIFAALCKSIMAEELGKGYLNAGSSVSLIIKLLVFFQKCIHFLHFM